MSKLFERLTTYGAFTQPSDSYGYTATPEIIRRDLFKGEQPALIRADSVAEYQMLVSRGAVEFPERDTCLVPPYDLTFVEYATPPSAKVGGTVEQLALVQKRAAVTGHVVTSSKTLDGWVLSVRDIVAGSEETHLLPVCADLNLDSEGCLLWGSSGEPSLTFSCLEDTSEDRYEITRDIAFENLSTLLYILSIFHYRDAKLVAEEPTAREVKKATKKDRPLFRYHTLEIKAMKETVQKIKVMRDSGLEVGVHSVRGHKATYTEEAPLFGKYVGTFFKAPHLRGAKEQGVILKDYALTMENQE